MFVFLEVMRKQEEEQQAIRQHGIDQGFPSHAVLDDKITGGKEPPLIWRNPDLSVSEETYQKLKTIIERNVEKPFTSTGTITPYEETRRKLNAIIKTVGEGVNKPHNVEHIKTPQELSDAIVKYYEAKGKGAQKPDAVCVDISLLVNEILKRYLKADSSIIIFHPVDKDGLELEHGHTTAAIITKGWLVDPATQSEAIYFDKIVLERKEEGYNEFYSKLEDKYKAVEGEIIFSKSAFVEFSEVKSENGLKAFYILENAARMKPGKNDTKEEKVKVWNECDNHILEAYKLNPSGYYGAINAGDIYRKRGDAETARQAYLSAAVNNMKLYLACSKAAWGLFNLRENRTDDDLNMAYELIKIALDAAKTEDHDLTFVHYYHYKIAKDRGYDREAKEAYKKYQKCMKRE